MTKKKSFHTEKRILFYQNEPLHIKQNQQFPGTMTIMGARDIKKVIIKYEN